MRGFPVQMKSMEEKKGVRLFLGIVFSELQRGWSNQRQVASPARHFIGRSNNNFNNLRFKMSLETKK